MIFFLYSKQDKLNLKSIFIVLVFYNNFSQFLVAAVLKWFSVVFSFTNIFRFNYFIKIFRSIDYF